MSFQQVKTLGEYYNNQYKGKGERLINSFFEKLVEEFADANIRYFKLLQEWPFQYRERQLHTSMFPAISKISEACFVEQPVYTPKFGLVDYWVLFDRTSIFLELKHSKQSIITKDPTDKCIYRWNNLKEQLKRMRTKEICEIYECTTVFKVGIQVIPFSGNKNVFENEEKMQSTIDNYVSVLNPDWYGYWRINPEIYDVYGKDYLDDENKYWGGVLLVGQVEKVK